MKIRSIEKKRLNFLFTILFFFAAACQPSEASVQRAISQTQTSQASTAKISFSEVDIQGILLQPGDLPANYETGQIKYDWPVDTGLPMIIMPDNFIMQMFKEKADSLNIPNFSMLALYDNKLNTSSSYDQIIHTYNFQNLTPPVAGDKNSIMHYEASSDLLTVDATLFVFQRCNALVVIRVFDLPDDVVFSYAKGLDRRIEKIACQ